MESRASDNELRTGSTRGRPRRISCKTNVSRMTAGLKSLCSGRTARLSSCTDMHLTVYPNRLDRVDLRTLRYCFRRSGGEKPQALPHDPKSRLRLPRWVTA